MFNGIVYHSILLAATLPIESGCTAVLKWLIVLLFPPLVLSSKKIVDFLPSTKIIQNSGERLSQFDFMAVFDAHPIRSILLFRVAVPHQHLARYCTVLICILVSPQCTSKHTKASTKKKIGKEMHIFHFFYVLKTTTENGLGPQQHNASIHTKFP